MVRNQIDQRRENNNVNIEIEAIAGACNTIDGVNKADVHDPCIQNNFIGSCIQAINDAYEEVVSWKRNLFVLLSDKELARLCQAYADESPWCF